MELCSQKKIDNYEEVMGINNIEQLESFQK